MTRILKMLVLSFAITAVCHAQTGMPAPAATASSPARPFDPYVRDASVVDHFIPVITMEQFYSGPTQLQGYRIQIFKDGQSIYHGPKNVKTLGEVRFRITREQVQKIQGEFKKYKFWEVPEDQYGLPKGFGVFVLRFTLRDEARTRTVRFGGQPHAVMLLHVIETEVNSAKWRCPFEDEDGREPCSRRDRDVKLDVPIFLVLR